MSENKEYCKQCKGECCKAMSGIYSPKDFKEITVEFISECLNNDNLSIDWWEGDVRDGVDELSLVYYLRPRHKGADITDPSWGGECVYLTDTGCKLLYVNRPQNCRDLKACKDNTKCNLGNMTKRDYIKMWLPHQQILSDCRIELL